MEEEGPEDEDEEFDDIRLVFVWGLLKLETCQRANVARLARLPKQPANRPTNLEGRGVPWGPPVAATVAHSCVT